MTFRSTYFIILALILLSSFTFVQTSEKASEIKLLTPETTYEAGTEITLKFSSFTDVTPLLYCANSYGSTLIKPVSEGQVLTYTFPTIITHKKGVVVWKLLNEDALISGKFTIESKLKVATMETYIGPPSIQAGGKDYSMLVVIPTDDLDNPLPKNTSVNAKYQFLNSEENDTVKTEHLISYKNIFSKKQSGRILVSSECLNTNSKEFTVNVLPAIPESFSITAQRPHDYADGNQITTFETSILKDLENNTVSDGTFVTFMITNEKEDILKTYGTTINGVAKAKMIHPDYGSQWRVKAFVIGMAESNSITLNYKQAITDFEVLFSENNRDITVGPLKSFMGQMIPDGLSLKLQVRKNNTIVKSIKTMSVDGYAQFKLKPDSIENDSYTISIQTAGIDKTFKNITLW